MMEPCKLLNFYVFLLTILILSFVPVFSSVNAKIVPSGNNNITEYRLAKLVKLFSKPGAFNQMNAIFGEDESDSNYQPSINSCPDGAEGLECKRVEARRSVDCPRGDCYCYNCAKAGPELWISCCKESLKCCSYLAAACRTCDQPVLHPFCSKNFKKCLIQLNDKKS